MAISMRSSSKSVSFLKKKEAFHKSNGKHRSSRPTNKLTDNNSDISYWFMIRVMWITDSNDCLLIRIILFFFICRRYRTTPAAEKERFLQKLLEEITSLLTRAELRLAASWANSVSGGNEEEQRQEMENLIRIERRNERKFSNFVS